MPPDLSTEIAGCHFAPRCKLATELCRTEQPALTNSSDNHLFACFHPINGPQETKVVIRDSSNDSDATPSSLLEVRNAVMNFPLRSRGVFNRQHEFVSAVSNVSFDVAQGETFGLVGESGCGKTTLGRLIVGLEEANSGTITFSGVDATLKGKQTSIEFARTRQMMFQDPYASLDPRKRVLEIIAEPLEIQNLGTRSSRYQQVAELLNEVGLSPEVAERYPHEFSGGQRQRIGLARALAVRPKLVITDEPVSALDVSVQAQILNLMEDLSKQHNLSYILISHDLAVVRYISDRIGVMYLGKLVEVGPSDDVLANPAHHYTQGLIDAVPIANVKIARERKRIQVRGELPSSINPPSGCRFRTRCPMATDICTNEEPPYTQVSPGHVVACHFPLRTTTAIATD
jgi:oligopeptide/dipeptide ABC transporter ATP-binding protein